MNPVQVETDFIDALRDAMGIPAPRVLIFPKGVPREGFEACVLSEGIRYYETELDLLNERVRQLEERKTKLEPLLDAKLPRKKRTEAQRDFVTAEDAIQRASRLRGNLETELARLGEDAAAVAGVLSQFDSFTHEERSSALAQPAEVYLELAGEGYTTKTERTERLDLRRARPDLFANAEHVANAARILPPMRQLYVPTRPLESVVRKDGKEMDDSDV